MMSLSATRAPEETVMQTWEYHIFPWSADAGWSGIRGVPGAKMMLDHFGGEGWELVSTVEESGETLFYFKRPGAERSGLVW